VIEEPATTRGADRARAGRSRPGRDSLDVGKYMDGGQKIGPRDLARYPEAAASPPSSRSRTGRLADSIHSAPPELAALDRTIADAAAREAPLAAAVDHPRHPPRSRRTAVLSEASAVRATHRRGRRAQRPAAGQLRRRDEPRGPLPRRRRPERATRGPRVLNDEIQSAREVHQDSTLRLETFRSAASACGLRHPDGRVAIYRRPTRRHAPDTEFT